MNEALSGGQALLYAVKVLGGFYIFFSHDAFFTAIGVRRFLQSNFTVYG